MDTASHCKQCSPQLNSPPLLSPYRDITRSASPDCRSEPDDSTSPILNSALQFRGNGFNAYYISFTSQVHGVPRQSTISGLRRHTKLRQSKSPSHKPNIYLQSNTPYLPLYMSHKFRSHVTPRQPSATHLQSFSGEDRTGTHQHSPTPLPRRTISRLSSYITSHWFRTRIGSLTTHAIYET